MLPSHFRRALLAIACAVVIPNRGTAAELTVQIGEEPRSIDSQVTTGISAGHVNINLFAGLYEYHFKTGEPEPLLAASVVTNKDKSEYLFKLRSDVFWVKNDRGEIKKMRRVTADDFVYSYRRMLSPKLDSAYAFMLYILKNGEAVHQGRVKDLTKLGVEALDETTLRITLEGPSPGFLNYLPHRSFGIVPKEVVELKGDAWTAKENIWTNGPYAFESWAPKKELMVVKNPHFPDPGTIGVDRVRFRFLGTASAAALKDFRDHKIDIDYTSPPADELKNLLRKKQLLFAKQLGTYFLRMNMTRKPLDDRRVRRALALTIPRAALVKDVTKGGENPAFSFIPDSFQDYRPVFFADPKKPETAHVEEAKKLLAEAGFPGGRGFPSLTYGTNESPLHTDVAKHLLKAWQEHLGIEIKLVVDDWKTYLANQNAMKFDIQRGGWVADMDDPMNFADLFLSDGGKNNTGFARKDYDGSVRKARVEADPTKRADLLGKAELLLMRDLPVVPLFNYVSINMKQPWVSGFHANKLDQHPLRHVKVDEAMKRKVIAKK